MLSKGVINGIIISSLAWQSPLVCLLPCRTGLVILDMISFLTRKVRHTKILVMICQAL